MPSLSRPQHGARGVTEGSALCNPHPYPWRTRLPCPETDLRALARLLRGPRPRDRIPVGNGSSS